MGIWPGGAKRSRVHMLPGHVKPSVVNITPCLCSQAARDGIPPSDPPSAKEAAAVEAKVEEAGRTTAAALHPSPSARTALELVGKAAGSEEVQGGGAQLEEEEGFPPARPMPQAAAKDEKVCMELPGSAKQVSHHQLP
jgi:hypothetical protein